MSATVADTCDIDGAPSGSIPVVQANFGSYLATDLGAAHAPTLSANATFSVRCTGNVTPAIAFDYGRYARGTDRRLRGPGDSFISYALRRDSVAGSILDDQPHDLPLSAGETLNLSIYGTIPALPADIADGIYRDQVYISLIY